MAVLISKLSVLRFHRFVYGILRREIGPSESRFARLRNYVFKQSHRLTLSLTTRRPRAGTYLTSTLIASRAVAFWSKPDTDETKMADKEPASSPDAEILQEADRLYHTYKPLDLYAYLAKHKDSTNEEVLWRLCRACRDVAQMNSTSAADKKKMTYEAMEYAKKCLEINDNNFASHKWYAICISEVGDYEGTQKKIANAYVIRDHFQKAIDLNPADATCRHLMGLWCLTFADMPWYQRKLASAIFGTPPSSTYEEALSHFEKGEEISPSFYSKNLLMLGKTLTKLHRMDEARKFLTQAVNYQCNKDEDKEAVKEAEKLLASIGKK